LGRLYVLAGDRNIILKRINDILRDISGNRYTGIGKPEP